MELTDYKSDGINLKSIVVPNAADFKAINPTKYANLQKVYIEPAVLKTVAQYANQDGGEFKISKTSGQKVFPGNPNSNDVSFHKLFTEYKTIQTIDLENLDTSNVTNMYEMFSRCTNLKKLNISNWNTSKVT
ncbi:MAG: BspA family leucine-rich repeat surface protein, partial [Firmicutes bacterium]|nr:BspA family leucine-rich repeat surface protein [Bacillota bacterium]